MRRATVLVVVTLVAPLWNGQQSAIAHETRSFDTCVKAYHIDDPPCRNQVEVGRTVRVVIRGEVRPRHVGESARVWKLRPHSSWEKVRSLRVRSGGRLHWYWTPGDDDIYNYTPWHFRFTIPGHGRSNIARVLVRSDDF